MTRIAQHAVQNEISAPFERICIWGAGLIGCSFAAALKARRLAREVLAVDRNPAHSRQAVELGLIDDGACGDDPRLKDCALHMIAVPVSGYSDTLTMIRAVVERNAVITDAGSTKGEVIAIAREVLGGGFARFVPGHPIAGKESSGPSAADAGLFLHRQVILTPVAETAPHAQLLVARLWQDLGANVSMMSPERHDTTFAAVSHLPHAVAFAYVALLLDNPAMRPMLAHAGAGFRDFSRIAGASPEMWRDIFFSNRGEMLRLLEEFGLKLEELSSLLAQDDRSGLLGFCERASSQRKSMFRDGVATEYVGRERRIAGHTRSLGTVKE
jgi:prephenate dehydrogenase